MRDCEQFDCSTVDRIVEEIVSETGTAALPVPEQERVRRKARQVLFMCIIVAVGEYFPRLHQKISSIEGAESERWLLGQLNSNFAEALDNVWLAVQQCKRDILFEISCRIGELGSQI